MTVIRAIVTVVLSALVFALIGGVIGYLLGTFMPGYYRAVFLGGESPDFDPIQVGLGQGITQGLAGGALVGLVIVAVVAWQHTRAAANR